MAACCGKGGNEITNSDGSLSKDSLCRENCNSNKTALTTKKDSGDAEDYVDSIMSGQPLQSVNDNTNNDITSTNNRKRNLSMSSVEPCEVKKVRNSGSDSASTEMEEAGTGRILAKARRSLYGNTPQRANVEACGDVYESIVLKKLDAISAEINRVN